MSTRPSLILSRPATESYRLAPKSSQGVGTNPMAKLEPPTDAFAPPGCRPCRVTWRRLEQGQRDTRRGERPGRGKREIQKLLHVPSPKTRQNLILAKGGPPTFG